MFLLLADAAQSVGLEVTSEKLLNGYLFAWLAGLIVSAFYVLKIVDHFRRKPPIGEELISLQKYMVEHFATKDELRSLDSRTAAALASLQQERRISVARLHDKIEAQGAAIGIKIDAFASTVSHEYKALAGTMHKEFQDLYRSLGRVEGAE